MALIVLRCIFVLVAAGAAVTAINSGQFPREPASLPWAVIGGTLAIAATVIGIDVAVRRKRLEIISAVYLGMIVGLFLTYVLQLALTPLFAQLHPKWLEWIQVLLGTVLCYTCISLLIQTKDDFRFIIPYVEFSKEIKGRKPYVLDTSVVIDGRIADVIETQLFDTQIIMPQFVIGELQGIADSSDRLRRTRGRRGLDVLAKLRANKQADLTIFERELPEFLGQSVDMKLVLLAKHVGGKIITGDYNLNKVAKLNGVGVINLNDIANALKPVFLPGETIDVRIVKAGEEPGQGVGYLDDGTMIVVEGARDQINRNVRIAVTSVLQTSAGRMVFGKSEGPVKAAV